ncbi:hypothetical protein BCR42DRAFT_152434 [Absidia repens]|uniref:Uncharacterized protein n=1 Tax=Absidia repens TaxID=90262 RepID=A0A1X2I243_9FUNG|nr:hypothetical protein BCR42DRAFT_152434 [Absidia repens]
MTRAFSTPHFSMIFFFFFFLFLIVLYLPLIPQVNLLSIWTPLPHHLTLTHLDTMATNMNRGLPVAVRLSRSADDAENGMFLHEADKLPDTWRTHSYCCEGKGRSFYLLS